MKKLWQLVERFLGIYHWHPKIALRYLPIVEKIAGAKLQAQSILEVGSGGLGIVPYIRRSVVGLDISFKLPIHPQLVPVKGFAESIPFADNSFATVVSLDTLEHIQPERRSQAISEMIRVAKKLVCIGMPCGELAEKQDQELKGLYESSRNKKFQFFDEQVEYGLPTKEWMIETLNQAAKKLGKTIYIKSEGNINLRLRTFLMWGWIANNFFINLFFRKILLLAVPLMRRLNQAPTYRQLFFVTIKTP